MKQPVKKTAPSTPETWYTYGMYNWSVDTQFLSKHPRQYTIWKLEQLINFGLGGEKLKRSQLRKYFAKLRIDPKKKQYLQFLLSS